MSSVFHICVRRLILDRSNSFLFTFYPGVLDAYRGCIRQIQLHGPTNFSPVIEHVIKFARSYEDGNNYFILLILTDGVISDMPQTIKVTN